MVGSKSASMDTIGELNAKKAAIMRGKQRSGGNAEHEAEEEESKLNLEKAREGRDISEIDVEEIPSLGLIIQQTKEERKEKRKRAASNTKKPKTQKKPAKPKDLNAPILTESDKCHQCGKAKGKDQTVVCEVGSCSKGWCTACLFERYELKITPKAAAQPSSSSSSSATSSSKEEDVGNVPDTPSESKPKPKNTKWRCAVCEGICNCSKCRNKNKKPPVSKEVLKKLKDHLTNTGQFSSVWDYLIYCKRNKLDEDAPGAITKTTSSTSTKVVFED